MVTVADIHLEKLHYWGQEGSYFTVYIDKKTKIRRQVSAFRRCKGGTDFSRKTTRYFIQGVSTRFETLEEAVYEYNKQQSK